MLRPNEHLVLESSAAKMYNIGGKMKVRRVTVLAPTRSRMDPNLGMDSATKSSRNMVPVRKTQRFQ
jgi:hypothetical protein